ncbi:hypothetical protein PGQ11_000561 [Apiospora arundinis]
MLAVAAAQEMAGVRAWKIQGIIRDCPKTENAPNAHPYYKCVVFHCTTAGGSFPPMKSLGGDKDPERP